MWSCSRRRTSGSRTRAPAPPAHRPVRPQHTHVRRRNACTHLMLPAQEARTHAQTSRQGASRSAPKPSPRVPRRCCRLRTCHARICAQHQEPAWALSVQGAVRGDRGGEDGLVSLHRKHQAVDVARKRGEARLWSWLHTTPPPHHTTTRPHDHTTTPKMSKCSHASRSPAPTGNP